MLVTEVLNKVRFNLSDQNVLYYRWDDNRLISLLNDCLSDIANKTELTETRGLLYLQELVATYDVPNAVKISHISYEDKELPFISHREAEKKLQSRWPTISGTKPTHVIYDLQRPGQFTLYPYPQDGGYEGYTTDNPYGIISYFIIEDYDLEIEGQYGEVTEEQTEMRLSVTYLETLENIEALGEEIDSRMTLATLPLIVHYITGHALLDNMDTQNTRVAREHLILYNQKLAELQKRASHSNSFKIRHTNYTGGIV